MKRFHKFVVSALGEDKIPKDFLYLPEDELFKKLTELGYDLPKIIEENYKIKYVNIKNYIIPDEIKSTFNISMLKQKGYLPYKIKDNKVYIATSVGVDETLRNFIKNKGYDVEFVFSLQSSIDKCFENKKEEVEEIEENSISDVVDKIITNGIKKGASDIHIEPQKEFIQIRNRIDGVLIQGMKIPRKEGTLEGLVNRIKIMSNLNIAENRKPQDGRIIDFKVDNNFYDIRVSTVNTIFGEKIVMRILDKSSKILTFKELGFEKEEEEKLKEILEKNDGIILLVGATGSGKTTTLYSMIDYINDETINISTIEDPVEKDIPNVNQVQVSAYVTYSDVLKSFLRQDPDVIVIGEIRDGETAELAIRSAMTGHLVLSTLHAKNIQEAPYRLINMGIDKYLIANTLVGILSQRLVRKICNYCKEEYTPNNFELKWLNSMEQKYNKKIEKLYKGKGCSFCNNTGYKGRTAITEVVKIDEENGKRIMNNEQIIGYNLVEKIAFDKILKGQTTAEEVLRNI